MVISKRVVFETGVDLIQSLSDRCHRNPSRALSTRSIYNAHPARGHDQKLTALKLLSVVGKRRSQLFDFGLQARPGKAKENDAGVGNSLVKDKLTEIAVGNHQNQSLFPGDCQDILIGKTRRIIAGDDMNVMTELAKVGNQSEVSALIEKEFHRAALERAPFGGFGETSSPVTISFA
jgi:hypothetical protein